MKIKLITAIFSLFLALSAHALTLQEAKNTGVIGELPSGYLGMIKESPEVYELMVSVNIKRLEHFESIAKQNKLPVEQVAALAGKKFIEKTVAGYFIQNSAGQWVKK